jgi:hypothetical protein
MTLASPVPQPRLQKQAFHQHRANAIENAERIKVMKSVVEKLSLVALLVLSGAAERASAYFDPGIQKWISRDPIREPGFGGLRPASARGTSESANSYAFVHNAPSQGFDAFGLDPTFVGCTKDQKDNIMAAIQTACSDLRDPALSCCAGAPYRFFRTLVGQCNHMNDTTITCLPDSDSKCTDACGRAEQSGSRMYLCDKAFTPECGSLACTVLHETVHLAGGDQDTAMNYERCSSKWGKCNQH